MIRAALFTSVLSMGFFTASSAHAGGCEKDTDCKGDRICEASVCVDSAPKTTPAVDEESANEEHTETPAEGGDVAKPEETEEAAPPMDPKDWWKKDARKTQASVLQAIFDKISEKLVEAPSSSATA